MVRRSGSARDNIAANRNIFQPRVLTIHPELEVHMRYPWSRTALVALALLVRPPNAEAALRETIVPACPWCGAGEPPAGLTSTMRVAPPAEPGMPLEITGVVYQGDGKTPAAGVLLYAWQTSAHGPLRGWLRTDARGRYEIVTVRPGPAAGGVPAQIQMTATPPGGREVSLDRILFDDDTLVTAARRAARRDAGGSGVVHPSTDARGVQHAVRDIILER
jgi:protocatechuate 3,4-dioxygenase beta subunit